MRLAYADPPYIGQARKHYKHDPQCAEVDHAALLAQLQGYDGWALSLSSPSLKVMLSDGSAQRAADVARLRAEASIPMPPAYDHHRNAMLRSADWLEKQPVDRMAPDGCRVAAWVKPFASFKRGVSPAYAWEPVLFKPARGWSRDKPTVRDWHSANITMKKGLSGAKPESFCRWLFDLLGAEPGDALDDLFPGTGIVGATWDAWVQERIVRDQPKEGE